MPHLVEGVHIEGHVVQLVMVACNRGIDVIVEFSKLVHIVPHRLNRGMENMRTIFMNIDVMFA